MKTTTSHTTNYGIDTYRLDVVKFNGSAGKHTLYQLFINGVLDSSYKRLNKDLKQFFGIK